MEVMAQSQEEVLDRDVKQRGTSDGNNRHLKRARSDRCLRCMHANAPLTLLRKASNCIRQCLCLEGRAAHHSFSYCFSG